MLTEDDGGLEGFFYINRLCDGLTVFSLIIELTWEKLE